MHFSYESNKKRQATVEVQILHFMQRKLNILIYMLSCKSCTKFWRRISHQSKTKLHGLSPGYTTEMYCVSCEVRTEFIYVM
jgi:hypothetical protein